MVTSNKTEENDYSDSSSDTLTSWMFGFMLLVAAVFLTTMIIVGLIRPQEELPFVDWLFLFMLTISSWAFTGSFVFGVFEYPWAKKSERICSRIGFWGFLIFLGSLFGKEFWEPEFGQLTTTKGIPTAVVLLIPTLVFGFFMYLSERKKGKSSTTEGEESDISDWPGMITLWPFFAAASGWC